RSRGNQRVMAHLYDGLAVKGTLMSLVKSGDTPPAWGPGTRSAALSGSGLAVDGRRPSTYESSRPPALDLRATRPPGRRRVTRFHETHSRGADGRAHLRRRVPRAS